MPSAWRRSQYSGWAALLAVMLSLTVAAPAQTSSSVVPDAQVEANVLKALAGAPSLANESISTNTIYGTVTLSGTVHDEAARTLAETLASRAPGVKKVIDELTIGAKLDAQQSQESRSPVDQQGADQAGARPSSQPDGASQPQAQAPNQPAPPPPPTNASQPPYPSPPANPAQPPYPAGPATASRPPHPPPPPYSSSRYPSAQRPPYPTQDGQYPSQDGRDRASNQPGGYPARPPYRGPYGTPPPLSQQPYADQAGGRSVIIPSGAVVRVRVNQPLSSQSSQPGQEFDGTFVSDVVADGAVAIPRGASVQGRVVDARSSGAIKGRGELSLQLTRVTLGGQTFPVVSDVWKRNGSDKSVNTVNSAVGLGAVGAIIGGIAGGGAGAAIGAGVGGAAGVGASAASGGGQVYLPEETLLTFRLAEQAAVTTVSGTEMQRLAYGVPNSGQMVRRYPPPPPPPYYVGPVYYPRYYRYYPY